MHDGLQALIDTVSAASNVSLQVSFKTADYHITVATGKRDLANPHSAPVSTQDAWLFGSGTKAMTAAMILQGHERSYFHVNDTVSSHINPLLQSSLGKTFEDLYGPRAAKVTIWHLLTMQAGVPDFDVEDYDTEVLTSAFKKQWSPLDFVVYGASLAWICDPGTCVSYSSTNYILLGYVLLANAKFQPGSSCGEWPKLHQRAVLHGQGPDIMRDVLFGLIPAMDQTGLSVHGSTAYGGGITVSAQPASILGWTCGNVITTTQAISQFYWNLLVDKAVVSEESLELMKSFRTITDGWGEGHLNYGAGLFVQQVQDYWLPDDPIPQYGDWGTTLGHGGATYGFISDQGLIPQLGATWSYVGNRDDGVWDKALTCQIINVAAKVRLGDSAPVLKCPVYTAQDPVKRQHAFRRAVPIAPKTLLV